MQSMLTVAMQLVCYDLCSISMVHFSSHDIVRNIKSRVNDSFRLNARNQSNVVSVDALCNIILSQKLHTDGHDF